MLPESGNSMILFPVKFEISKIIGPEKVPGTVVRQLVDSSPQLTKLKPKKALFSWKIRLTFKTSNSS